MSTTAKHNNHRRMMHMMMCCCAMLCCQRWSLCYSYIVFRSFWLQIKRTFFLWVVSQKSR